MSILFFFVIRFYDASEIGNYRTEQFNLNSRGNRRIVDITGGVECRWMTRQGIISAGLRHTGTRAHGGEQVESVEGYYLKII